MHDKVGRNDLCPCGSGKKYKKCCRMTSAIQGRSDVVDFKWHQLRQLVSAMIDQHLLPYAIRTLPEGTLQLAFDDILPEDLPEKLDKDALFISFFVPWFLFNVTHLNEVEPDQFEPNTTVAQTYVKRHGDRLNRQEKQFIEAMNSSYYSFYSVLQVEKEKALHVKDILLGTTHTIKERDGTYQRKRGDIIFSRLLTLNHQSISVGMMPFIVPINYQNNIIDFREFLVKEKGIRTLNATHLRDDVHRELLYYFFHLMKTLCEGPIVRNTDGELLQMSTSYFKLALTPKEALSRLLSLTLSDDPEDFLQEATLNKADEITRIEFPWLKKGNKQHKDWDNTVMGHITIEQGKLTLETNSEKRTERGKKLLRKHLGKAITFQQTLIESLEKATDTQPNPGHKNDQHTHQLLESPEAQEQLEQMAKAHWKNWLDQPIPALNNKTPRKAAKTKAGRERLEAILLQYERYDSEKDGHPFKADIPYLRKTLVLD